MSSTLARGLGALLLSSSLLHAPPAAAQEEDAATRAAARNLAEDGVAALQAGDSTRAVEKLDKAFRTLRVPSIALWSGRALLQHGRLVEAAERLLEATRLPPLGDAAVQEQAKAEATKELEQLRPRIPKLVVVVEGGADASVTLDGKAVPAALLGEERPVNPGTHQLVATRGAETQRETVTVAAGERKEVRLRFAATTNGVAPGPAPRSVSEGPPSTDTVGPARTLAFVALGVGGAGLVLGGVTGAMALAKKSALDDNPACRADQCLYEVEDDVSTLRTLRTVSTVGLIAGGALAATGAVLLLTGGVRQPSTAQSGQLVVTLSPSQVRLRGTF